MTRSHLPHIEVDDDGYPTEESLKAFREAFVCPGRAARWMVDQLPNVGELIHYGSCEVTGDLPGMVAEHVWRFRLVTMGWSGWEDLIGAMQSHFWIDHFRCEWKRGGLWVFEVPKIMVEWDDWDLPDPVPLPPIAAAYMRAHGLGVVA